MVTGMEATKSKGGTWLNWSDFLLQKLHSNREALNLRGPWPFWPPISAAYTNGYGTVVIVHWILKRQYITTVYLSKAI